MSGAASVPPHVCVCVVFFYYRYFLPASAKFYERLELVEDALYFIF